jgi:hypothetical protein
MLASKPVINVINQPHRPLIYATILALELVPDVPIYSLIRQGALLTCSRPCPAEPCDVSMMQIIIIQKIMKNREGREKICPEMTKGLDKVIKERSG